MLSHDVVSHHQTPDMGSRCPVDTEALFESVSAAQLYTMPDFYLRLTFTNSAEQH